MLKEFANPEFISLPVNHIYFSLLEFGVSAHVRLKISLKI
jgi:hypothetical protein